MKIATAKTDLVTAIGDLEGVELTHGPDALDKLFSFVVELYRADGTDVSCCTSHLSTILFVARHLDFTPNGIYAGFVRIVYYRGSWEVDYDD